MLEGKDFLLLVVAAAEAEPLTPVQLQKALFLINESNLPEAPANERCIISNHTTTDLLTRKYTAMRTN